MGKREGVPSVDGISVISGAKCTQKPWIGTRCSEKHPIRMATESPIMRMVECSQPSIWFPSKDTSAFGNMLPVKDHSTASNSNCLGSSVLKNHMSGGQCLFEPTCAAYYTSIVYCQLGTQASSAEPAKSNQ
ncbi:hypothetical protein PIB30_012676 [Stylosanthes scabra]|uniref:Uncharacterized protein n=1 Tax=Stylosanthes scabra TaxID=79078 RepID=A0ABU6Q744_9FABA|nr:hypothetical protein [Stylosanthes scabra]